MKKRLLLTMTTLMLGVATMMAVPAKPGVKKTVKLSDGSTVELTLKGDEHYSYYTDEKGTPCQVVNGRLVKMTPREVTDTWTKRKQTRMDKMNASASRRGMRRAGESSKTTTGTQNGLVILMQFPDVEFVTANPKATFTDFFNKTGFNKDGMAGSVQDYFKEQSYGQLTINFDVVGPFTTSKNMEYYGKPKMDENGKKTDNDTHPALMVAEAVDSAYKDGVDFSKYDWDGDGEVDQVFVIYAGYAEAQGADKNTIWPHEWVLAAESATKKYNGVTINTYGCASELASNKGTTMDGIGTACHEFSHCLGLPDFYDTTEEGANWGMGYWDIMCAGSYNDSSRTPAGYTSYEHWFSGWLEPTELKTETAIKDMKALAKTPEAYILYNEKNKNEYYMLENRQPVGFDKGLYGHGLLILHVDYNESTWKSNTVNNIPGHERMTIIPADNEKVSSASSMAGDPWPGTSGSTYLGNFTTPAADLFNANTDGTKKMNKSISSITEDENAMTVSFVACRPEMDKPNVEEIKEEIGENSLTVTWPAISGAVGYELELTSTDKAPSTPAEALRMEVDFSKCYSKTAGFTDINSKLKDYGLSGWSGEKLFTSPQMLRIGTSSTTGQLITPNWEVPASTDITVVFGANIGNKESEVSVMIQYYSKGDKYYTNGETLKFKVTGEGKYVLTFKNIRAEGFRLTITPDNLTYLNYMAVYDGEWTAEQLGISNSTPAQAARRAVVVNNFTTTANSFTFENLVTSKRYVYRLRALGEDNTFSAWSDEKSFEFNTTGIQTISTSGDVNATARYYDLQGREVSGQTRGLIIRKQGNKTVKILNR